MKTFSASQLSHTPALVFAEARANGAIIQQKRTNGEVSEEFVILDKGFLESLLMQNMFHGDRNNDEVCDLLDAIWDSNNAE